MRYEPPNAPARKVTIPNAYPESSRLDATAINAPTIPKEIDTPQSPGWPSPAALNPWENQLSSRAKRAAIPAFIPDTSINSRKRINGVSRGSITNEPAVNPSVIACIPIHRLEAATPSAARFPEPLCNARPWSSKVASRIITATPTSPPIEPAVEPIANRTRVAWAAIAS